MMNCTLAIPAMLLSVTTVLPKAINEDAANTFEAAAADGTLSRHETFFLILALALTVIVGVFFVVMLKVFNAPPGAAANVAPDSGDETHDEGAGDVSP